MKDSVPCKRKIRSRREIKLKNNNNNNNNNNNSLLYVNVYPWNVSHSESLSGNFKIFSRANKNIGGGGNLSS